MPEFEGAFGPRSAAVYSEVQRMNKGRMEPLTKFDREKLAAAKPIYIYNVSPVHSWAKHQGQLGTVMIPKRERGQQVSKPFVIPGIVFRWYDKGLGRREKFEESGMDVAQDICGCSPEFPAEVSNNNLTNFGVFIIDKPFEDLSAKRQQEVLSEANQKMLDTLRRIILEADQYWAGTPQQRGWIGEIHRSALAWLNEIENTKEERPWAPVRSTGKHEDCRFCGSTVKPGVVVCPTCRNVLDEKKYEQMGGKKAS